MKVFSGEQENDDSIVLDEDNYESVDVLVVSNFDTQEGWVMDLGISYNLCPRKNTLIFLS